MSTIDTEKFVSVIEALKEETDTPDANVMVDLLDILMVAFGVIMPHEKSPAFLFDHLMTLARRRFRSGLISNGHPDASNFHV